ncbi:hypothetical protein Scep_002779 [Stephania cephalantha]|uniref:Kinetochore protein Nuf2 N-terminal domain-containing protein n=1 Tax=Stephania cephalantha TaxID=152367 RepID=A0AAP0Q5A7_9MAGN
MSSSYQVQQLSRSEIVSTLAANEIHIREEDLLRPTPDFASSLYSAALSLIDPLQDEDHGQADFHALGRLENPDLHADSVRVMNLFHKIKDMVAAVFCPTPFTLKDLLKPDPNRTALFLSALLNFYLHILFIIGCIRVTEILGIPAVIRHNIRVGKLESLRPYVDPINSYVEKQTELESQIAELNAEIAVLKHAREMEQPLVLEVDAKVKELRQTIQSLNTQQMSLKASFRTLRDKTKEIEEKISNADFALVQSAQENAKLRSKIVQSPEKLQGAVEEKKVTLTEAKNSERSAMQAFQEKTTTLEIYSKAAKKMSKQLAQMQAIQEQVNSGKAIDKDVKVLKAKLSDDRMLEMSLEAKLVERQGKVEQLEELRKAFEKERDLKYEEATKRLNSVKLEVESKRNDLASRGEKVQAMIAEVIFTF